MADINSQQTEDELRQIMGTAAEGVPRSMHLSPQVRNYWAKNPDALKKRIRALILEPDASLGSLMDEAISFELEVEGSYKTCGEFLTAAFPHPNMNNQRIINGTRAFYPPKEIAERPWTLPKGMVRKMKIFYSDHFEDIEFSSIAGLISSKGLDEPAFEDALLFLKQEWPLKMPLLFLHRNWDEQERCMISNIGSRFQGHGCTYFQLDLEAAHERAGGGGMIRRKWPAYAKIAGTCKQSA